MTIVANTVSCAVEHGVALLTLNHPPVNALTPELLAELGTAFEHLAKDERVKVVILTGTDRFFIAGADIRVLAAISSSQEGLEMALRGQTLFNTVECFEKPVLAAINGACLGGGLELALCCHIRLAADSARLGQPEINLGIIPGFGGTQRLSRLLGTSKALELILTGDPISALDAKALGLVAHVVPADDLLRQAQGIARKIATKGQAAVRAAMRAVREGADLPLAKALEHEATLFSQLCDSEDKREGVMAFLQKRQPQFKDR
jgi:enoyl-CoA hydratase